jgi:hypothetical protein
MRKVKRLNQFNGSYGVWVWWIYMMSACTSSNETQPAYRLAGTVVTAGTNRPLGVPVNLGICYRDDDEARNPLVTWTTDSAGNFDHAFRWFDDPDRLKISLLNRPIHHFEPMAMPVLNSRSMTNLRVELPAMGWLRLNLDLTSMGQGGLATVQAGSWLELFYGPQYAVRTIPWNSMVPLQVQVHYRSSSGSNPFVSHHHLTVPPLDTVDWTWTP